MFIESIQIQDGHIKLKALHLNRIQTTQLEYFGLISIHQLDFDIPQRFQTGLVKCRIHYHQSITKIAFEFYRPRIIHNLKLVEETNLDYHLKYADRSQLDQLKMHHPHYSDIIITQHGYLTDTSFANIVLFDGNSYVTPSTYLLNGIQRQYLLQHHVISERTIHRHDLHHYQNLYLINAMLIWDYKISIPITNITA